MKVRFQADADFDRRIVQATLRHEASIDLQLATAARGGAGLRSVPDNQVLAIAAQEGRLLLSHDHRTMPRHFATLIALEPSPGVIIIPQRMLIRVACEQFGCNICEVLLGAQASCLLRKKQAGRLRSQQKQTAYGCVGGNTLSTGI